MERYSEVVGLPVICVEGGRKVGTVSDVIFCPKKKSVICFVVESNLYNIGKKVIMLKDVLKVGKDAVIINDSCCIIDFKKVKDTEEFKEKGAVNGLRVYTRDGQDIGTVKDVLFDVNTASMDGVEISDGILDDLIQGRNILPLIGKVEFSEENILVDSEAIEEMINTGGGLKKKLIKTKERGER